MILILVVRDHSPDKLSIPTGLPLSGIQRPSYVVLHMTCSVLIPTLNEASNLSDCLESVKWSNDIVVVDSGSRDGTPDIARNSGAEVVQFAWNRQHPKKKNWALEHVPWKNDWVLILDADERITPELATEIREADGAGPMDGFYLNRRFMFMGKWIRHCGYYPSWNLRLFKHRLGRYEKVIEGDTGSGDNEVHEHVILSGNTGHLRHDMLHYAYPDISTWMEKHNRYSNWEARVEVGKDHRTIGPSDHRTDQTEAGKVRKSGSEGAGAGGILKGRRRLRELSRRMPFRPALRFFYSYVLKRGFLDGYEGYVFCRLLATYEMLNVFKAEELRRRCGSDAGSPIHGKP